MDSNDKLMFFNGKFRLLWVDKDRYIDHHRGFWDNQLNYLPDVEHEYSPFVNPPQLPTNINDMIMLGEKLSHDFPHARIDFYDTDGIIYFGEITFYSSSGYGIFHPDSFDFKLGSYFDISSL